MLAIVVVICLLAGCESDERILEQMALVQTSAYDLLENNKIRVLSSIPVIEPDSDVQRQLLTAENDSIKEARLIFSRETDLTVVSGQMRNTLFGISIAKAGLARYIDTLLRDPSIALGVKVTVVNGGAGELLSKNYKSHLDTGRYIDHLLEKEASVNSIPKATLYEFSRDYNDDGVDPVAPMVKDAGEKATIDGIALFNKDRYVMRIPARNGLIFALMKNNLKQGEIALNMGEVEGRKLVVMFSSLLSKRKVKVHHLEGERFSADIHVNVRGSILEYTGQEDLTDTDQRKKLEEDIAAHVTARAEKMIQDMQRNKVDSLGIGQYVRNSLSYKRWKATEWKDVYPRVKINCRVKVKIKDYGKYI
ncbi:Ger(x)C family spore germination protein [Paenibacillus albidus]|nr:Ger(x)C family spore germination protein [Paenibacillus albidus]